MVRKEAPGTIVSTIVGAELDSDSFRKELLSCMARSHLNRRCLLIHRIEPLASAAGRILNGSREKLGAYRVVVVVIRDNRKRDFLLECPDLMDWVGTCVARAEDLAPALTLRRVRKMIRELEKQAGMNSHEFQEKWAQGHVEPTEEHWLWNELLNIRSSMESGGQR